MNDADLLKIAREAITSELENRPMMLDEKALDASLKDKGAVFVTLTEGRQLRGCIGSLEAYRPLGDDLVANAKAAAFDDPRFYPLSKAELVSIKIEISILTKPQRLEYGIWEELRSKIVPFEHGVILRFGNRQATFLPQVWEQLPDTENFLSALAQKAGIEGDISQLHPEIEVYTVRKIKE